MLFPLTRRPVSVVFLVLGFPSLLSIGPCPCCFIYFFLAHRHSFSQSLNQWGEEGREKGFMVYQKIQQMNRGRTVSLPRWQAPKRTHALDNWMHRRVVSSVTQMKLHPSVHYDAGAWKEPFDSYSYSCRARPRLFGRLIGCASKWESARHVCRWLRTISW